MIDVGAYGKSSDGGTPAMYVFGKALYSQTLHLLAEVPPGAEDQMPDPTQDRTLHKMEEEDVQLPDLPGKDICRFGIL